MIELHGLTRRQRILAETLWNKCTNRQDVDAVLKLFGHDARVVYEMMIAHAMDQYQGVEEAAEVLSKYRQA